jgi:hypothetical protein
MYKNRKVCFHGIKKLFFLFVISISFFSFSFAQNPIADENKLAGTSASVWDIPDASAGDPSIQGYADNISVNVGGTIHFKVDVNTGSNKSYNISIYRLGYYGGDGARLIQDLGTSTGVAQDDNPATAQTFDGVTGLVDCGKWVVTSAWTVPGTAVSGLYIAKLTRPASAGGGTSHIPFVVRNDTSTADLYFKTSDATWQAYNGYGGYSLYVGANMDFNHANKVSYNRPFKTREGGGGGGAHEDWLMTSEYPMIRFLESNGYNISYTTDVDVARNNANNINLLLNHKVFLSVGHDEYWSKEERNSVEAAKAAGVNLAFFSGNEVYWKTRWENSVDGTNTPFRTMVCYKEGTLPTVQENACQEKCDVSTNEWTGLWRDGCNYPGVTDACKPENALSGQISWDGTTDGIDVPVTYKNLRFWRNTPDVANLSGGEYDLPNGTLGYEWDWEQYENSYPPGRVTMSSTLSDGHTHKLSLYKDEVSKALVFGAGTVQWAWGLDENHDVNSQGGGGPADQNMQQATVNLLADMGAQPATLQSPLVAAEQSTDVTPAKSVISTPVNGAVISEGSVYTISGTATDVGGVVAGVDISINGGPWLPATGTDTWTYSWTPTVVGPAIIKSRAFDDIGNLEAPGGSEGSPNTVNVTINEPAPPAGCPCYIFTPVQGPALGVETGKNDSRDLTLGVKFRANYAGTITAVKFYKDPDDDGTNTVQIWNTDGDLLGSGTGTGAETPGSWVSIALTTPVGINANQTYIASYHSETGYYSATDFGFTNSVVNGSLTALADGTDGPNGIYNYGEVFPSSTYNAANYWVDVVYVPNGGSDTNPPAVSFTSPSDGGANININSYISVTFNEDIDPATVNGTSIELRTGVTGVPATVSYTVGSRTATLIPTSPLGYAAVYTATVKAGGIKDIAGNALASDYIWNFTTEPTPPTPPDDGTGGPVLIISGISDLFSRYPVEILRAEGYNAFDAKDISEITPLSLNLSLLNNYDVIILGHITLSASDVSTITDWVTAGGTLIALRPDANLAPLLGITPAGGTLSDGYLLVNTSTGLPGAGIVGQTIQFHGDADLYTLSGATALATLFSDAVTTTANPAVTSNKVGTGKAIAFTYDLARSVVYTRQGNPAWAATNRDGEPGPIRSDNLFFPDYIDFDKIAIPQADEQQHLLTNIILLSNLHRKPLPHLWFLPKGSDDATLLKAAVIMTGDDHAVGNTEGRFNEYLTLGPNSAQDVADWKAVRGTSYLYTGTPITDASVASFQSQGFEIALHPNTGCLDFTPASLNSTFTTQLQEIKNELPSMTAPVTNRTHCMPWSDWATQPKIESSLGIRFDVNYYYWPDTWVNNRPGMFTGSGMPMRFADLNGSIIDCYQAPTQMPDESGLDIPFNINSLLDSALGPQGYYGAFVMNMHTDQAIHPGSDAIIASAQARGIPIISAKQMLTWLDTRNNTIFGPMTWTKDGSTGDSLLSFTLSTVAHNLQAMVPLNSSTGSLVKVTESGAEVGFTPQTVKGISYGVFNAATGNYTATYSSTALPITLLSFTVTKQGTNDALLKWTTSMEQNNKGFEIQRSTNASGWTVIGFVHGAGNSQTNRDYQYIDDDLANGTYYYRLRQVDYDGKSDFSKIASVNITGALSLELLQNRPNPFTGNTTIEMIIPQSCRVQLTLYDQMGRLVEQLMDELKNPGKYQVEVNKNGLSSGTYYYKLNAMDKSLVRKMTIL